MDKYVIIRAKDAGCFAGFLKLRDGDCDGSGSGYGYGDGDGDGYG